MTITMKKSICVYLSLWLFPALLQAQVPIYKEISPYERYTTYAVTVRPGLGLPMGGLKDYISKSTLLNYSIGGEVVFKRRFSVGALVSYGAFEQREPRRVYAGDGVDISAVQTRTFSNVALVATGAYHFAGVNAPLRPYVQAGVGFGLNEYANYWGLISDTQNGFRVQWRPAVGAKILFKKEGHLAADVQAAWMYSPFEYGYMSHYSNVSLSLGLSYRWW